MEPKADSHRSLTDSLASLRKAYAERACAPLIAHLRALRDVHIAAHRHDLRLGIVHLGKGHWAGVDVEAGGAKVSCRIYGCASILSYPEDSDEARAWLNDPGVLTSTVDDQTDGPALAAALAAEELRLRGLVAAARTELAAAMCAADTTRAALLASIPAVADLSEADSPAGAARTTEGGAR